MLAGIDDRLLSSDHIWTVTQRKYKMYKLDCNKILVLVSHPILGMKARQKSLWTPTTFKGRGQRRVVASAERARSRWAQSLHWTKLKAWSARPPSPTSRPWTNSSPLSPRVRGALPSSPNPSRSVLQPSSRVLTSSPTRTAQVRRASGL